MKTSGHAYSPKTSLEQVPFVFKWLATHGVWYPGCDTVNLDVGGGAFNEGTAFAAEHGVKNLVHDIGNRTKQHNDRVMRQVKAMGGADMATVSNVLNVIPSLEDRLAVLQFAREGLGENGVDVFVTVYEGSKLQQAEGGQKTSKGWQEFRPTQDYVDEVAEVFPYVQRHGKVIVASLKP